MVEEKVDNILQGAFGRFAKEQGAPVTQIQIAVKDTGSGPVYMVSKEGKWAQVPFGEIHNVLIDFLGIEQVAAEFMRNAIMMFGRQQEVDPGKISIIFRSNPNYQGGPERDATSQRTLIALYKGAELVKHISWAEVFND